MAIVAPRKYKIGLQTLTLVLSHFFPRPAAAASRLHRPSEISLHPPPWISSATTASTRCCYCWWAVARRWRCRSTHTTGSRSERWGTHSSSPGGARASSSTGPTSPPLPPPSSHPIPSPRATPSASRWYVLEAAAKGERHVPAAAGEWEAAALEGEGEGEESDLGSGEPGEPPPPPWARAAASLRGDSVAASVVAGGTCCRKSSQVYVSVLTVGMASGGRSSVSDSIVAGLLAPFIPSICFPAFNWSISFREKFILAWLLIFYK